MRRTQIQLDEETYQAVRTRAFATRRSLAGVIRDTLASALKVERAPRPTAQDFQFVGAGRSKPSGRRPVSEAHDAALADAFASPRRRRP